MTGVLVIGESLIDIVRRGGIPDVEHVGGSPANVAIGLARLSLDVQLATCIGTDARGRRIAAHMGEHGVVLTVTSTLPLPTSTAVATLDETGAATYDFALRWEPGQIDVPRSVGHVHTGSIAALLPPGADEVSRALDRARSHATVSYDPNIRPTIVGTSDRIRAQVEEVIRRSDVVKASEDDVAELYPGLGLHEVLTRWTGLGPSVAVVTRAGEGATYRVGPSDETVDLPAPATTVVDTVGAGDSFMAGLVSGLLSLDLLGGAAARERLQTADAAIVAPAVQRGLACGAATVARAGAYAPTLDQL